MPAETVWDAFRFLLDRASTAILVELADELRRRDTPSTVLDDVDRELAKRAQEPVNVERLAARAMMQLAHVHPKSSGQVRAVEQARDSLAELLDGLQAQRYREEEAS